MSPRQVFTVRTLDYNKFQTQHHFFNRTDPHVWKETGFLLCSYLCINTYSGVLLRCGGPLCCLKVTEHVYGVQADAVCALLWTATAAAKYILPTIRNHVLSPFATGSHDALGTNRVGEIAKAIDAATAARW